MAIHIARPERVSVRLATPRARVDGGPLRMIVRALALGFGVGIVLIAAPSGIASVLVIGVIALVAALVSWEP